MKFYLMKTKSVNMIISQLEVITVRLEDHKVLIKIHLTSLTITFLKISQELITKHTLKDHLKREKVKILFVQ